MVSIPACHAGDRGSIPRRGGNSILSKVTQCCFFIHFTDLFQHKEKNLFLLQTKLSMSEHRWFSGRMLACHAGGPGSIPGRCSEMTFCNGIAMSAMISLLKMYFCPVVQLHLSSEHWRHILLMLQHHPPSPTKKGGKTCWHLNSVA